MDITNKAPKVISEGLKSVNPLEDTNIFNRAFEALWEKIFQTGQKPGEDIYDWTHPKE